MKNQPPPTNLEPRNLKTIFFGTSDFAVSALNSLLNFGYKIEAVVTQPEKPAGRLRVTLPSPVKKVALEHHLHIFEPHNLKDDEDFFKNFHKINPDICIVASYGKIIPSRYLEIPKYGFINIHPSLLPKYRGPSPIQTSILSGDQQTGVTIMMVDQKVDSGPILGLKPYYLLPTTCYAQAEKELAELGAELLIDILPKYISGEIKPQEQNHTEATFTKMLNREDGLIDWNKTAEQIYNQIRALNPEPGTWTTWSNKTLNIKKAEVSTLEVADGVSPGTISKVNNSVVVATKKCYLILKQIQLEGGKEMDAQSFLNGHPDFLDSVLE